MINFLALALAVVANATSSHTACSQGVQSFQNTVYTKVRRDCVGCHGGTISGIPPFASADPVKSYNQLINYVNFFDVQQSLLVVRAGNNHCKISLCQTASGQEMATDVQAWWQGGENQCQDVGQYVAAAQSLPATLPAAAVGFSTLSFDLSSLKPELQGVSFQIEVQDYMDASPQTLGAYRFRAPRFVGGHNSIYAKGLKILLNGAYAGIYNVYNSIDATFPFFSISDRIQTATSSLSGNYMLMLKDGAANPQISVSFVDIKASSAAVPCTNASAFVAQMKPVLTTLNCASCHQAKGSSVPEKALDLGGTDTRACQGLSSLIDSTYFTLSAAVKVPTAGVNHPQLTDDQRAQYMSALRTWLNL